MKFKCPWNDFKDCVKELCPCYYEEKIPITSKMTSVINYNIKAGCTRANKKEGD